MECTHEKLNISERMSNCVCDDCGKVVFIDRNLKKHIDKLKRKLEDITYLNDTMEDELNNILQRALGYGNIRKQWFVDIATRALTTVKALKEKG